METLTEVKSPWRRRIGSYGGTEPGPVVVCVGGIHGNETAGIRAAEAVLDGLEKRKPHFRGEFVAIGGNLGALALGKRYQRKDLNRVWTMDRIKALESASLAGETLEAEDAEQLSMWRMIEPVLARSDGPAYFLDLHTSSADGPPFATMGDTIRNRGFVTQLPVPVILGLEEQIDGALLEFINNLGHITVGAEGGRHGQAAAVGCHEALLWLALLAAGCLAPEDLPDADIYRARLVAAWKGLPQITEVRYRHAIKPADEFKMEPGFTHFQRVLKGQLLGNDRNGPVRAQEPGVVLLPLYQALGDDGFFLGREVRPFWLKVSAVLRKLGLPAMCHLLPGVRQHPAREDTLIVNTKIARLYPLDLFHLLGYRKRRWQGKILMVTRRREEFGAGATT